MARRCILHFGMHKTGSSSIQHTLARLHADVPWVYLEAGIPNASLALATMFKSHPESHPLNRKLGLGEEGVARRKQDYFQRLEEKIASTGKDLLLSAEWSSKMSESELRSLADWLGKYVDEIVPVGYIRSPRAYMESSFQQKVKAGASSFDAGAFYPDYRGRFEKFEAVFGRDKVQYWPFDPRSFPAGCVVRDFAARFGVALSDEQVVRVNDGVSREALSILYCYRKFGEGFGVGEAAIRENQRLIRKLGEIKGHKLRFAPELVRTVLDANQADIAWMEARLNHSFGEDLDTRTEFDIADEADMLACSRPSLDSLRAWAGASPDEPAGTPQEVAKLVGRLRHSLPGAGAAKTDKSSESDLEKEIPEMNLRELLEKLRSDHPEQFGRINDKEAVGVLRAALSEIRRQIEGAEEGAVRVPSLGSFQIRRVEREVDGKKTAHKRVAFRAAPARKAAAD